MTPVARFRPRTSPRVHLLDGGGSYNAAHVEDIRRAIHAAESLPYSDAHPVDPVERFGRRLRRFVVRHETGVCFLVGIVLAVVFVVWVMP